MYLTWAPSKQEDAQIVQFADLRQTDRESGIDPEERRLRNEAKAKSRREKRRLEERRRSNDRVKAEYALTKKGP